MDGILLLDKPAGASSNRVLNHVRRWAGTRKVGHTGTLDPLATGLLQALIGRGTRLAQFLPSEPKEYLAEVLFGVTTDTADADGKVIATSPPGSQPPAMWEALCASLVGTIQLPVPKYAAVKVSGRPLYRYARAGQDVELPVREMTIFTLSADTDRWPSVSLRMSTSRGTYVRAIAVAMGEAAGCGAHVTSLRRTRIADWSVDSAVTPERLLDNDGIPGAFIELDRALSYTTLTLSSDQADCVAVGRSPEAIQGCSASRLAPGERFQFADGEGRLLAVARSNEEWSHQNTPPAFDFERVIRERECGS
jgi:tRNA pseudouridine55 synthase